MIISMLIGLIMFGLAIGVFPLLNGLRHPINSFLLVFNSVVFLGIGGICIFISLFLNFELIPVFAISALFGMVCLCLKVYTILGSLERFNKLTKRQRIRLIIIPLCVSIFLLISLASYSSFIIYSGAIFYEGDAFSTVYFKITGTPLMSMLAILVCMGGLIKTVTVSRAGSYVANILIFVIPVLMWIMVLVGVTQPPPELAGIFMGDIAFIFLYLVITVCLIMIMYVFQYIKLLQV